LNGSAPPLPAGEGPPDFLSVSLIFLRPPLHGNRTKGDELARISQRWNCKKNLDGTSDGNRMGPALVDLDQHVSVNGRTDDRDARVISVVPGWTFPASRLDLRRHATAINSRLSRLPVKRRRTLTPQNPNRSVAYDADRRPDPTPIHTGLRAAASTWLRDNQRVMTLSRR
jgi:hypothetical protein